MENQPDPEFVKPKYLHHTLVIAILIIMTLVSTAVSMFLYWQNNTLKRHIQTLKMSTLNSSPVTTISEPSSTLTPSLSRYESLRTLTPTCMEEDNDYFRYTLLDDHCQITNIACGLGFSSTTFRFTYPLSLHFMPSGGQGVSQYTFVDSHDFELMLIVTPMNETLDQLNQLIAVNDEDLFWPKGPLDTNDQVITGSTHFTQIGDKRVLVTQVERTVKNLPTTFKIYFFTDPQDQSLYQLEIDTSNNDPAYLEFVKQIEGIIKSIEFLPSIINEDC